MDFQKDIKRQVRTTKCYAGCCMFS